MITASGYIITSSAIGETEMPDDVRIALVERMVKNFAADNPKFDADRFRFACKVFPCRICAGEGHQFSSAGDIKKHWQHILDTHPEYEDIVSDRMEVGK